DFHFTAEGWRISEANTDVPGGFNEASAFARLMAPHFLNTQPAGDPAGTLAEAIQRCTEPDALIGLVHATSYSDDRQVMVYLARELSARGRCPVLLSPLHLKWKHGEPWFESSRIQREACTAEKEFRSAALLRFFPAEWLANLPDACEWNHFF